MKRANDYTKGPWRYEQATQTVRSVPENYCVTSIRNFGDNGSTDAALGDLGKVAALIAAAPEMLEALELLTKYCEEIENVDNPFTRLSRRAIAKAKGGAE